MLKLDVKHLEQFLAPHELEQMQGQAQAAWELVQNGGGPGEEFLGWFDLPINYDREEFDRILEAAAKIRDESQVLLVAGIGGSYLGAKAFIEAMGPIWESQAARQQRQVPEILYVGNNLSPSYYLDLIDYLGDRDFSLNIVSKSGGTLESALAFRLLRQLMEEKYGEEEAASRIYATTDKARGKLKSLADEKGYETFVIPDNIGGRYSVLTAVGLLPMSVAGLDIRAMLEGAQNFKLQVEKQGLESDLIRYAMIRNALYRKGYRIEVLASFEQELRSFSEWWKQLFGESEGKDQRGIYPASVSYSTDLHSLGQFMQDGSRIIFETFLVLGESRRDLAIPSDLEDKDQLNYLAGKSLAEIQAIALEATALAHADGGVPNLKLTLDRLDEVHLGALIFFFETACAVSAYLNAINPFDQEGVEAYKKNMFALMGKPGMEELAEELRTRI
ncbi:MAG: glucose-6-phosphate isomerase [Eubacteriales bacterium]|nr:glucose-6-phosphate isomerase [Eubacteriales bacterium]